MTGIGAVVAGYHYFREGGGGGGWGAMAAFQGVRQCNQEEYSVDCRVVQIQCSGIFGDSNKNGKHRL